MAAALLVGSFMAHLVFNETTVTSPKTAAGYGIHAGMQLPSVGVQFHGLWSDYTDADRTGILDAMAKAGLTRVRVDMSWPQLQPRGRGEFDASGVSRLDNIITMANQRGLRPLITLWLTPQWATQEGERSLPEDPSDYAHAAAWAAGRWAGQADWEIWNEPNSEDFLKGADPIGYTALVRAAYPAIKKADPSTTVVVGSLQYNDDAWLRRAYEAGLQGNFDVLSTHPYQSPGDLPPDAPDDGERYRLMHVAVVHELMAAHGDGDKQIWFTELGWSTFQGGVAPWQRGVTPELQAEYLVRSIQLVRAEVPYVGAVFIYRDRDESTVRAQIDGFGILHHDLTPKPALGALSELLVRK